MRHSTADTPSIRSFDALRGLALATVLPLLAFGLMGCAGSGGSGSSSEMMTVNDVIESLRQEGLNVSPGRQLSSDFARDGIVLNAGVGDNIRVYEFTSSNAVAMELSRKSPSAGSPPFYYKKGNIMLVHAGNSPEVEKTLRSLYSPERR